MKYCTKCGGEVTGSFCQNCGQSFEQENQPLLTEKSAKINIMALTGFVIGCISLLLNFWGIVGIVALVFSVVGIAQVNNGNGKGKGLAIAGIALGAFSVIYGFIMLMSLII